MDNPEFETLLLDNLDTVLQSIPDDAQDMRVKLSFDYASLIFTRFQQLGQLHDLEEAIDKMKWIYHQTSPDHENFVAVINNLGVMIDSRYKQTGNMEDLDEAIQLSQQAVEIMSEDHPDFAPCLNNLGNKLESRYKQTGKITDLDNSIQVAQQAVKITPKHHPDFIIFLNNLGAKLMSQYERIRKMDKLKEAIQVTRQAIQFTPKDHFNLAGSLNNLGVMLESQYKQTTNITNLEEAIQTTQQAIKLTPKNHPDRPERLNNLGNQLKSRYQRTGNLIDLEKAIQLSRQAVETTPTGHSDLAERLNNLGNQLKSQYKRIGKIDDLKEAIQLSRQAIKITPKDHSNLAIYLSNLGTKLESQYEWTGKIKDLEEAIQVTRQAVEITPEDHPDIAVWLNNLGIMLESQYKQTENMGNLEEAIQVARQAVKITPKSHSAAYLNNLGNMLESRYERTGERVNLEEAIQLSRQAIEIMPKDYPDLAACLNNLGNMLESRYNKREKIEDLDEAILLSRQAVEITSKGHPDLAGRLNNLGTKLESRYRQLREIVNLKEAIYIARQAVKITPKDHPNLAAWLINLGRQLISSESSGEHEALELFLQAWNCPNAPPLIRIRASTRAVQLLQDRMDYTSAYKISTEAIELLPRVHSRSLDIQDQQYVLSLFSGLATNACSLALQTGEPPGKAVELLERGRGVILSLLMDDRSDVTGLKAVDPTLYTQYEGFRTEVNRSISDIKDQRLQQVAVKRRPEAIKDLENCIEDIRELPGFGQFQKAPTVEQMKKASEGGNIIFVNITDLRSDALIISGIGISSVPLPRFNASHAKSWIDKDLTTPSAIDGVKNGKKNKLYCKFLSWLWLECVNPILQEARYKLQSTIDQLNIDQLPRIWWIGTGLASSFPFHAAGDNLLGSTERTCYWAISSYTPSIKALMYAKERASTITTSSSNDRKLLIISMPTTPAASKLSKVGEETAAVIKALEGSVSVEVLEQPDVASVLHQIQECTIAHFACHGVSNPIDPSESGLLLQKSTTEPIQDILSIRKVSQTHLAGGEIAYLSACSTAETRAARLVDEVLHIVSGFQIAGFRHVVGCLWPSSDSVCVEVARLFYSELGQGQNGMPYEDRAVAVALHKAVMKVCESKGYGGRRLGEAPLKWAQYVHYGA